MPFTKTELKIIKYNLMNKHYTEAEAEKEIAGMIETDRINHARAKKEKKEKRVSFKDEFRRLRDGDA